jgi:hypothetical protein
MNDTTTARLRESLVAELLLHKTTRLDCARMRAALNSIAEWLALTPATDSYKELAGVCSDALATPPDLLVQVREVLQHWLDWYETAGATGGPLSSTKELLRLLGDGKE